MIINQFKTIYYRGFLRSCNYQCSYCPFSKNKISNSELDKDKRCLDKFLQLLKDSLNPVTLFIVPYGEALIHDYYLETISKLSSQKYIDKICIQTNNSFHLHRLLHFINVYQGDRDKIKLWCTYHPAQVSAAEFLDQCLALYETGFQFSVGGVADYNEIKQLAFMRKQLPSDVYMWLNKMDGLSRKSERKTLTLPLIASAPRHADGTQYNSHEINEFLNIDPLFELRLLKIKSDINKCMAGKENVFIDYKGDMYPCNINKYKIGNIYEKSICEAKCRQQYCSCFLSSSNRDDLPLLNLFKEDKLIRIMPRNNKSIYFFDIDGTIVSKDGRIIKENINAIQNLSNTSYIFLNTALPFRQAYIRCKEIWKYIHGGIFSNGSDIRIFEYNYARIIPMDSSILMLLDKKTIKSFPTYNNGTLHKILIKHNRNNMDDILLEAKDKYNISHDKSSVFITDINASKLKGALFVCRFYNINHKNVVTAGNSKNDSDMISYFKNSIFVNKVTELHKKL